MAAARQHQQEAQEQLFQHRYAAELQHEAHLERKAREVDSLAEEAASMAVAVEAFRAILAAQFELLDSHVKRIALQKQQIELVLAETQHALTDTQQVMSQDKQTANNHISFLQEQLKTRSQELTDSQSEVAQLTELTELKAQLESQIAVLGFKLASSIDGKVDGGNYEGDEGRARDEAKSGLISFSHRWIDMLDSDSEDAAEAQRQEESDAVNQWQLRAAQDSIVSLNKDLEQARVHLEDTRRMQTKAQEVELDLTFQLHAAERCMSQLSRDLE